MKTLIDPEKIKAPLEGGASTESALNTTAAGRRKHLLVMLIALCLASYFAVAQLAKWPGRLRYPGEEDAAEGTQLAEMVHLHQGTKIYRVPSNGEFDSAIYGPFCYLLGAAIVNPNHPAYLPLRLLSLIGTLSLAAMSSFFVFRLTRNPLGAALAPVLLFASVFIARYGISARADMVALMFAFAGFLVFYCHRDSRPALMISAALMLLSFFYKQQFIGAPSAVFLYLVIARRFRVAFEWLAYFAIGGAALVAAFSIVIFPHQFFLLHFLGYNHLPFEKSYLLPEVLMFAIPLFVPLLGSADYADGESDKLVACYVATSVATYFLLLTSSGSGADTNRCLEAVVVLTCAFAARLVTAKGMVAGVAWTGALALTLSLVAVLSSAFIVRQITDSDVLRDRNLQAYLRTNFSPGASVLTYYAGDPLRAGLQAPVTNLWHYSALVRKGAITNDEIASRIDRGGYSAILLDFDLTHSPSESANFYTTSAMRDAVLRNYQQIAQLEMPTPELTRYNNGNIYVWVPKAASREQRTDWSKQQEFRNVSRTARAIGYCHPSGRQRSATL